ncbi:hypothetical protein KHDHEBDM_01970 [Pectobacterium polaris]|nr:hypothetical protein KHDHEBDM_01970 [Pectobacterium polaris]
MVGEPEGSHKRPDIWLQYLPAFLLKSIAIYGSVHIRTCSVFTIYPLLPLDALYLQPLAFVTINYVSTLITNIISNPQIDR